MNTFTPSKNVTDAEDVKNEKNKRHVFNHTKDTLMTDKHVRTIKYGLIAFGITALWYITNKFCYQIRTDLSSGWTFEEITNRMMNNFSYPWHISLHPTDIAMSFLTVFIVGAVIASKYFNNRAHRHGAEHGSARWATKKDMRPYQNPDPQDNILFTQTERLNLDSRKTQRNLNVLTIGGSSSGKSRYFVMPNINQHNTSFAITDPKGELLRATGDGLEKAGYKIRCLNLIDFTRSDSYNPFAYFDPHQPEVSVAVLVENFVTNTSGDAKNAGKNGDFFEKAERALLTGLVAYVYALEGEDGNLIKVADLVAQMKAFENDEEAQSPVDEMFEAALETIKDYTLEAEHNTEIRNVINMLQFACSQYNTYTQGAGETQKSVIISLAVRIAPLNMSNIRKLFTGNSIKLDMIGQEKTALFLIMPDSHSTFTFIASIFYDQLFTTNLYIADTSPTGRLTIPLQCYMDEFANIGKMPSFEKKIAVMRSRGISVAVIVQNFAQGKALYKDHWETIVGNCDSLLFLGGNEKSTTEYISKMLGKQTIAHTEISITKGRNGSSSKRESLLGRELLTPDEIGRLDATQCIYMLRGLPPALSHKLAPIPEVTPYTYNPHKSPPTAPTPEM